MSVAFKKVEELRAIMVEVATASSYRDQGRYQMLRGDLLADPRTRGRLPRFVTRARTPDDFWAFIKAKFGTYAERRAFLLDEFDPLLTYLEQGEKPALPIQLGSLDAEHVEDLWRRCNERAETDPAGAITAARSLIESVCKLILDDASVAYGRADDLEKLYKSAARRMNLAPEQHSEQSFKQILQGCISVVIGLAGLRGSLGDAHGKGRRAVRPLRRHAELAVDLAGAMSRFLAATWADRGSRAEVAGNPGAP